MDQKDIINQINQDNLKWEILTDGLGFHRKPEKLARNASKEKKITKINTSDSEQMIDHLIEKTEEKKQTAKASLSYTSVESRPTPQSPISYTSKNTFNDLSPKNSFPSSLKNRSSGKYFTPSLPKLSSTPSNAQTPLLSPALAKIFESKNTTDTQKSSLFETKDSLKPVPISLASIMVDFVFVFALSLILLSSLIRTTNMNIYALLEGLKTNFNSQLACIVSILSLIQMYVLITRSFFGCTLGEWTFNLQMGTNQNIKKSTYPFLVLWRACLIFITGFVFLPILSFLLQKDISYPFTGIQLYKKT